MGCETCEGTGAIHLDEYDQVDPYDIASRSESRENALGLKEWRGGNDFPLVSPTVKQM